MRLREEIEDSRQRANVVRKPSGRASRSRFSETTFRGSKQVAAEQTATTTRRDRSKSQTRTNTASKGTPFPHRRRSIPMEEDNFDVESTTDLDLSRAGTGTGAFMSGANDDGEAPTASVPA